MRIIYRIAKLELSTLFYSPVAWLILTIFAFQAGLQLMEPLAFFDGIRQTGSALPPLTNTFYVQGYGGGFFPMMISKLYLYIPLLTMGLMSRETSSGSIKLLLSSPVRMGEIILGKYLAMMVYGLILCVVLLVFCIFGVASIKDADLGLMFAGLLSSYLLICAYAAIGLFMSSLTSYQIVAAISTLAVLAALSYIGKVAQNITAVREITYFLSLSGRTDDMITGLLNSKDIIYYLIVIVLFLGLSILKLQSAREFKPASVKALRYAILISFILVAGYLTSRSKLIGYSDVTTNETRTLTPNTQKIIQNLGGQLTMTTYVNLLDDRSAWAFPAEQYKDLKHFEKFQRFLPNLVIKYVYYYDSCSYYNNNLKQLNPGLSLETIAKKVAVANDLDFEDFLSPKEISKQIDLSAEGNELVRTLEVNGKKSWLRMFNDITQYPTENEFGVALKRLEVTVPKVGLLTGHNERSIKSDGDRDFKNNSCRTGVSLFAN
jgi:ABC-2 type transport system permease protein